MLRNERGEGRLGVVVWLLFMAAGIFVAVRTIPTRMAVLELHDFADAQVQRAGSMSRVKPEELINSVLKKAQELEIPLEKDDLDFDLRPNDVRMTMRHRVVINLEVYEWVWDFDKEFTHLRM
ncbi:MAG: hypothetical protein MUE47_06760 [Acidobacteria bacterium]|jgi:hypothetical protein|nr:hypothetical protein [Acidobacteriota bacterium]